MDITVELIEKNQKVEVNVSGEIDAYTAPKLREALDSYTQKENMTIIVNLSEVAYIDSTGLGVFVGAFKTISANKGNLKIIGLSDRLKRLFDITGLAKIMDINCVIEGEKE